jgi:hypothetical protein
MNLKQLLKKAGVSNEIIKEVERKAAKTTAEQEIEHQERTMAWTKIMLKDVLYAQEQAQKNPPVPKKKTIIIPDER